MHPVDPIFVSPRCVERDWGRHDLGEWRKHAAPESGPIGEIWILDPANRTDDGPLGRRLTRDTSDMLGDLGRAPPKLRLVFPGRPAPIKSSAPISLWQILEAGEPAIIGNTDDCVPYRPGDRIRAYEGAMVSLAPGSVALETSSSFLPNNSPTAKPSIVRLPAVSARTRATLLRDAALSVEIWTLPALSQIEPDGETCHVLTALTSGVAVDGKELRRGEAVLVPAWGRRFELTGAGAKVLIAYPDARPTTIWRHVPGPDPVGGLLPKPEPPGLSVAAVSRLNQRVAA